MHRYVCIHMHPCICIHIHAYVCKSIFLGLRKYQFHSCNSSKIYISGVKEMHLRGHKACVASNTQLCKQSIACIASKACLASKCLQSMQWVVLGCMQGKACKNSKSRCFACNSMFHMQQQVNASKELQKHEWAAIACIASNSMLRMHQLAQQVLQVNWGLGNKQMGPQLQIRAAAGKYGKYGRNGAAR